MIVVIDYGMGNLGSILNMLKKLRYNAVTSSDPAVVATASKLVLPGVGAFDNGMANLNRLGFIPILQDMVLQQKIPILGICLGMQLFTKNSEEGIVEGLGWLDAKTVRFRFDEKHKDLKIPHMGWNTVKAKKEGKLFENMYPESRFYFVHSYHLMCNDEPDVLATTFYGYEFVSAVQRDNIMGVQFHPEKSHKFGLKLVENFTKL